VIALTEISPRDHCVIMCATKKSEEILAVRKAQRERHQSTRE
jgi:hypothetical protein